MTEDTKGTAAPKKRRGRAPKKRGAVKPDEHPDSVDHARKCGHAVQLKYLYEMSWEEVAATPWPINPDGDPEPDAVPMWNSGNSARKAVTAFQQMHLAQNREDVLQKVLSQIMLRQQALAPAVSRGDMFAIQQHRADSELLMKATGGYAPTKVALTTPDGKDAVPLVESGGLTALLAMARQSMGASDSGGDADEVGDDKQEDAKSNAPESGDA